MIGLFWGGMLALLNFRLADALTGHFLHTLDVCLIVNVISLLSV